MNTPHKALLISLGFLLLANLTPAKADFADVSADHPYRDSILALQESGVVQGYEDGSYRPDQQINRAEFLKIAMEGSGIPVYSIQPQQIFPDVSWEDWFGKYAARAKLLGIVSGDADTGRFRPSDPVNLAEALKIIFSAAKRSPAPAADGEAWYQPYFTKARSLGLLEKNPADPSDPGAFVTRGFMAELMKRLQERPEGYEEGVASYYGLSFDGRGTASGEKLDNSQMVAAHKTLPFNSWAKVTNLETGESVMVRIIDRGPYVDGRVVDLSQAAFKALAPLSSGLVRVSFQPQSMPPSPSQAELPEPSEEKNSSICQIPSLQQFDASSYQSILLNQPLSGLYLPGQVISLSGTVAQDIGQVTAFLVDEEGVQYPAQAPVYSREFEMTIPFPHSGNFKLGLIPGNTGSSVVKPLYSIPQNCLTETENSALPAPRELELKVSRGSTRITWEKGGHNLTRLSFMQGEKWQTVIVKDRSSLILPAAAFKDFAAGEVNLIMHTALWKEGSPSEISWSAPSITSFKATERRPYQLDESKITLSGFPESSDSDLLKLTFDPLANIQSSAALILPNGKFQEVDLSSSTHSSFVNEQGVSVLPAAAAKAELSFPVSASGVYVIEINDDQGLAALNFPVYPSGVFPLLPSLADLTPRQTVDLGNDLTSLRQKMLDKVNQSRSGHRLAPLSINEGMNLLAQHRANDMAEKDYFSHWDQDGKTVNDLREKFGITTALSENLAKEVTIELAHEGLMNSAKHRAAILDPNIEQGGFGLAKNQDGSYTFVQLFSAKPLNMQDLASLREAALKAINQSLSQSVSLSETLNQISQNWSQKMAEEDFFEFTSPNGETLASLLQDAGVSSATSLFILSDASLGGVLGQIEEGKLATSGNWKSAGIGIGQDQWGIIKVTVVYSE